MTTDEIKALADKLLAEVEATLSLAVPCVGNTNAAVLRLRADESAAALRQLAEERDLWREDFITSNAALARAQEERDREERFLRALMDTAQWNADALGDHKDKLDWRALALSIATHLATPPAQPFSPPDGQT